MKRFRKLLSVLLSVVLILSTFGGMQIQAATPDTRYSDKYLQNGSFEENVGNYNFSSNYTQPQKIVVPYWDTTAYNTDGSNGKMEFFKKNAAHFNQSSTANRDVADGEVAAELNADEVSTIYQRIKTVSGSTYTWGLDHRGRDTTDTMVLFIGPEQYASDGTTAIDPSKPNKNGQDQFVKMTDWLKTQYGVTYPKIGCSQKYTIYSKPFAEKGAFQNESSNADENFSMTKTDECNQEWSLWVISSEKENKDTDTTKAINGWSKYGTNRYNENDDSYKDVINGAGSKLGYDCTYTVPKGQTKTLFAFTSYSGGKLSSGNIIYDATYGNLLDDINFKLYQPISSSITEGGTGGANVGNATITNDIQNGNMFYTTVNDGNECTIHTKVTDGKSGHVFQGAYVTVFDDAGNPITKFVGIYPGETSGLTEAEKLEFSKTYFMPDDYYQHEGGETWDFFYTVKVDSPVHIHMMYTKAPYVLYDSNGGEPYQWTQDNSVGGNLVGFSDSFKGLEGVNSKGYYEDVIVKTIDNGEGTVSKEITPGFYKSHAALPNSKWLTNDFGVGSKFLNWTFNDADGNIVTINGEHQVTYDPSLGAGNVKFNNLDENGNPIDDGAISGLLLDATHGITLTAQWQFGYTAQAQTLLGHALETQKYENSDVGGWVEETFINDRSNVTDYKDAYTRDRTERTDAYGSVGEKIIFRATPDSANNYVFDGWYTKESDGSYKLVTTAPNLAITVEEGKSTTYYARFKTKTVPVIFHYSASGSKDDYVYYDADADNKYGKYFQEVVYNKKAIKPTGDSKKVTMWFTSPTERSVEKLFNFNTPITKETHLYASPSFGFNFFNHFEFTEPRAVDTYATVKVNGKYIDLKNDTDVTDYNIYISKGALGDTAPNSTEIKTMSGVKKYGKKINSGSIIFNSTTTVGQRFNRIGVTYADLEMQTMRFPVWVNFDFTYKGIQYTAPVYDRSLYNNIQMYKLAENQQYYTSYPKDAQDDVKALHEATVDTLVNLADTAQEANLGEPTAYAVSCDVDGLVFDEASANENYTFSSSTAVRNIEPWGFKYTFSVNEKNVTDFDDYGAVVLTDNDSKYDSSITVSDIINDSNSVMFSFGKDNVYLSDDEQSIEVYYCENITSDNFDKITYVVFFVKDGDSYYYSSVVANSYNEILDKDVDNTFAPLIRNYSQTYKTYINTIAEYDKKYGEA